MSHQTITLVFITIMTVLSLCKKYQPNYASSLALQGTYAGKYGYENEHPSVFYSFILKANGILEEINPAGQVIGKGSWSVNGNKVYGIYYYEIPFNAFYSVVADMNLHNKQFSGTWGYGKNESNGGTWIMAKKSIKRCLFFQIIFP